MSAISALTSNKFSSSLSLLPTPRTPCIHSSAPQTSFNVPPPARSSASRTYYHPLSVANISPPVRLGDYTHKHTTYSGNFRRKLNISEILRRYDFPQYTIEVFFGQGNYTESADTGAENSWETWGLHSQLAAIVPPDLVPLITQFGH